MYFSQQQQKLGKTGQVSMKLDFRFYHFMEKKNNLNHIKKFRLTIFSRHTTNAPEWTF